MGYKLNKWKDAWPIIVSPLWITCELQVFRVNLLAMQTAFIGMNSIFGVSRRIEKEKSSIIERRSLVRSCVSKSNGKVVCRKVAQEKWDKRKWHSSDLKEHMILFTIQSGRAQVSSIGKMIFQ